MRRMWRVNRRLHSDEQGGAQVRSAFRVENEAWNVQAGRAEAISPALRQSRAPPKRRMPELLMQASRRGIGAT
mgnify:CR=1 FL=1